MGPIPFAFSVHHFVNSVGADAGFASIIGLAILVLLYFAHARETAALRSQAEESSQRVQELEARVARLGQTGRQPPGVVPVPATAPSVVRPLASAAAGSTSPPASAAGAAAAGATATGAAAAPASAAGAAAGAAAYAGQAAPGAPAGVGAPPLTAATRLIPTAGAGASAPPEATGAAPARGDASALSTAPGAAPAGTNGTGEHTVPPVSPAPPPRRSVQVRPGAGTGATRPAGAPPIRPSARPKASGGAARRWVTGGLVALALAAIVVVLLVVTSSGGGGTPAKSASSPASNAPVVHHHHARPKPAAFNNASVTVAVLNGTPINQLAHRTAEKLIGDGFKQGTVTGASDQTHTATVVAYMPGKQSAAQAVAKALGLGSASVQPVDPSTQAVACPPSAACTANVVVTLGTDLANQ